VRDFILSPGGRGNEFTFKVNKKAVFSSRPFLSIQRNKKAVEPPQEVLHGFIFMAKGQRWQNLSWIDHHQ
jgi:hypothetical protein